MLLIIRARTSTHVTSCSRDTAIPSLFKIEKSAVCINAIVFPTLRLIKLHVHFKLYPIIARYQSLLDLLTLSRNGNARCMTQLCNALNFIRSLYRQSEEATAVRHSSCPTKDKRNCNTSAGSVG